MKTDIGLLCELLLSTAIVINRPAVRRQLLAALAVQGVPESVLTVLVQGFEWRDLAKDLQWLVDIQSKKVHVLAREDCLRGWEVSEKNRLEKEAWKARWDTSYWTPGNPVYDRFYVKT